MSLCCVTYSDHDSEGLNGSQRDRFRGCDPKGTLELNKKGFYHILNGFREILVLGGLGTNKTALKTDFRYQIDDFAKMKLYQRDPALI